MTYDAEQEALQAIDAYLDRYPAMRRAVEMAEEALALELVEPPPPHVNCSCELEWWTDTTAQVLDEPDAEGARMVADRTDRPPSPDVHP